MNTLATSRAGRCVLHLLAAFGDHEFRWHIAGIFREFHWSK